MHDPANADLPVAATSLEQQIIDYFGPEPVPDASNRDVGESKVSAIRQNCARMRQQLLDLCCQFQRDCDSVDLIEMFSLLARLKRMEQTEIGLAKQPQRG